MKPRIVFRLMLIGLIVLILVSVGAAYAANMTIQATNVGFSSRAVMANELKPVACTMDLTNIVRDSPFTGTDGNDLIIGSSGNDTIDGLGGDDCILGGGGDDSIDGNTGTDICIGGDGNDTFTNCETQTQ